VASPRSGRRVGREERDRFDRETFIDQNGRVLHAWNLPRDRGTSTRAVDGIAIADVIPGGPLEVALAEQGGNEGSPG